MAKAPKRGDDDDDQQQQYYYRQQLKSLLTTPNKPLLMTSLTKLAACGGADCDDASNNSSSMYSTIVELDYCHHPQHASIRTLLQVKTNSASTTTATSLSSSSSHYFSSSNNNKGRLVVQGGPDSTHCVHATFAVDGLMVQQPQPPNCLCWATFQQHQVLCLLVNPTTLTVYDIYPTNSNNDDDVGNNSSRLLLLKDQLPIGPEGWTISLPFECCGIFGNSSSNSSGNNDGLCGILLQRMEDAEDRQVMELLYSNNNNTNMMDAESHHNNNNDDYDDDFILQAPPRFHHSNNNHNHHHNQSNRMDFTATATTTPTNHHGGGDLPHPAPPQPVSSLFSLSSLLDDVRPVCEIMSMTTTTTDPNNNVTAGDGGGGGATSESNNVVHSTTAVAPPVTDAFEKIIWVGTCVVEKEEAVTVVVTYHSVHCRHAIYALQDAPVEQEPTPLYMISRNWHSSGHNNNNNAYSSLDFVVDEPPPLPHDDRHLGNTNNNWQGGTVSRNDALADALLGSTATAGRSVSKTPHSAISARPRRSARDSDVHTNAANISAATSVRHGAGASFFSTTTETLHQHHHHVSSPKSPLLEASTLGVAAFEDAAHFRGGLEPKLALRLLYKQDDNDDSFSGYGPADSVFLCSDLDGNGLTTICLFFQSSSQLLLWSLKAPSSGSDSSLAATATVIPLSIIPCRAAIPVELVPGKVDICVETTTPAVSSNTGESAGTHGALLLYRAEYPICRCAIPPGLVLDTTTSMASEAPQLVSTPYRNRITIGGKVRATLSLDIVEWQQNSLVQKVLTVWESVLSPQVSLAIRADIARLCQENDGGGIDSWDALQAVWQTILTIESEDGSEPMMVASPTDDWEALLESSYHESSCVRNHEGMLFPISSESTVGMKAKVSELHQLLKSTEFSSMTRGSIEASRKTAAEIVPTLFDTTFLLYEDCKISSRDRAFSVAKVARLLLQACRAFSGNSLSAEFVQYIENDVGAQQCGDMELGSIGRDGRFTDLSEPFSILEWIDGKMKGVVAEPYQLASSSSSCCRISLVTDVFNELFSSEKRNLHIVRALLDKGYHDKSTIQESLCIGVSLPILDLLYQCRCDPTLSEDMVNWSPEAWSLVDRLDLSRNAEGCQIIPPPIKSPKITKRVNDDTTEADQSAEDPDGLFQLEVDSSMLFRNDNRVKEAARLLRSSSPVLLQVPRPAELSDHEYEKQKQIKLLSLARRTLALPVGRGMITIGGLKPVPAEPLPLAELCLKGRLPATNATIALDVSECAADLTVWPEFHNGVAAGLRLPLPDLLKNGNDNCVTRTWILYNRPPQPLSSEENAAEAAAAESKAHCHGGVLLALGLRGHLDHLEMSDVYDYLTKGTVTTTVGIMLGLAANKRGSCDLSVSKMLCLHIPSLIPQHFSAIDVASAVQSAAVLGTGLLFQRSSHRMMTEFLLNEIGRRPDSDVTAFDREAYTLSCGIALGMVNLCLGGKEEDVARAAGVADLNVEERLFKFVLGGVDEDEDRRTQESNDRFSIPYTHSNGDAEKCCVTYEGDMINTDVTAPGAILALGLMYIKSGNQTIASALKIPDTHFLLEFVRPDFLTLRTFSRALVLWDEIEPTKAWIDEQIPRVVAAAYEEIKSTAKMMASGHSPSSKSRKSPEYDRRAVRQVYVHVMAGGCFGMGLRFAGTGDSRAKAAITECVMELAELRDAKDSAAIASRPELPILETCLGLAAISLALVLAGTGDVDALRLFRVLQWRCGESVSYGNHMVFGMAIGLLFVGGGRCTVGREPEDIAALVAAFFPRFPTNTSDNQSHLQALRHLYSLAVREKEVVAVDIDSGERVHVEACVSPSGRSFTTPFLLRNFDAPQRYLEVHSDDYFSLRLPLEASGHCGSVFYVKKRHKAAMTEQSKSTLLPPDSIFLDRFGKYIGNHFSADPTFGYLCKQLVERGVASSVSTYLSLARTSPPSQTEGGGVSEKLEEWDLQLALMYYRRLGSGVSLVQGDLLAFIVERVEAITGN